MQDETKVHEGTVSRWVTFTLEDEVYGIDVMQIKEVLRAPEISPVPGAPSYVMGIINLRGTVVAVIDTRSRFGLAPREVDDSTRIIVLEAKDYFVGFLVDSVREVAELFSDKIEPAPATGADHEAGRYISGLYNRDSGLLIMIDASKLLSDDELAELAAI